MTVLQMNNAKSCITKCTALISLSFPTWMLRVNCYRENNLDTYGDVNYLNVMKR